MRKFLLMLLIAYPLAGMASAVTETEAAMCEEETGIELAMASEGEWYCTAKDSCGAKYTPKNPSICRSHAKNKAIATCESLSDDPRSCYVGPYDCTNRCPN